METPISDPITINGKEGKQWQISKVKLCSKSAFFRACLEGGFREAREKTINLLEDDPDTVERLLLWLRNPGNGVFLDMHNIIGSTEEERINDIHGWIDVFMVADKYSIEGLDTDLSRIIFKGIFSTGFSEYDLTSTLRLSLANTLLAMKPMFADEVPEGVVILRSKLMSVIGEVQWQDMPDWQISRLPQKREHAAAHQGKLEDLENDLEKDLVSKRSQIAEDLASALVGAPLMCAAFVGTMARRTVDLEGQCETLQMELTAAQAVARDARAARDFYGVPQANSSHQPAPAHRNPPYGFQPNAHIGGVCGTGAASWVRAQPPGYFNGQGGPSTANVDLGSGFYMHGQPSGTQTGPPGSSQNRQPNPQAYGQGGVQMYGQFAPQRYGQDRSRGCYYYAGSHHTHGGGHGE